MEIEIEKGFVPIKDEDEQNLSSIKIDLEQLESRTPSERDEYNLQED